MGQMDAANANLKAAASAAEPIDRLNILSRWITAKLEEFGQAEARIDKRLEHLNATEQSLKGLFESLRSQVAETHPVLKELSQLRADATTAVNQVVRAANSRSASAMQIHQMEQQIQDRIAAAEKTLTERAANLTDDLNTNLKGVTNSLEQRLVSAQQNADAIVNRAGDKLNVIEARVNQITNSANVGTEEAIARIQSAGEAALRPVQERLQQQVGELETRTTAQMADIEDAITGKMIAFHKHLNRTAGTMDRRLADLVEDFQKQAETSLVGVRQLVRQQIDTIEEETRLAVRPILQNMDDRRIIIDRQIDGLLSGIDDAMKARLSELRRSGEAVIQLVEAQHFEKLKTIRPVAEDAIDAAQRHVGERLQAALDSARASIELSEKQLVEKIEDLRPRAAAAIQTAQTDLHQRITSLESEAATATGWIEQRITQRIQELTYRARNAVADQLRDLDDASQRLKRRETTERPRPTSTDAVEVDVRMESSPPQPRSSAA